MSYKEHKLSDLDKWILGFLTIAEQQRISDKPHSGGGGVIYTKMSTNPFQLAAIIPHSLLTSIDSLYEITNTLDELVKNGLLENVPIQGHTEGNEIRLCYSRRNDLLSESY